DEGAGRFFELHDVLCVGQILGRGLANFHFEILHGEANFVMDEKIRSEFRSRANWRGDVSRSSATVANSY
ncbi:MAG: hypothetical protein ACXWWP_09330, partial [Candidatus Binatia bacterium]